MREQIVAQLIRDEGLRLKPYKDTVGKLSIGVGRNLTDVGITQAEAELLLSNDIDVAEQACRERFSWWNDLNDARKGAVINLCFNMGITRLMKFPNTLELLKRGLYEEASVQLLQSKYAQQVGDRALRVAEQIRTGQWL
jgi:lysozyme